MYLKMSLLLAARGTRDRSALELWPARAGTICSLSSTSTSPIRL